MHAATSGRWSKRFTSMIFSSGGIKNPPPFEGGDELIPTFLNMNP
jgi:hypothetical protein